MNDAHLWMMFFLGTTWLFMVTPGLQRTLKWRILGAASSSILLALLIIFGK